jgi:hypothetical protein
MGRSAVLFVVLALSLPVVAREARAPSILLGERRGEAVPIRAGWTHVGGGTIEMRQSSPDGFVLSLVGAVAATAHPCGSDTQLDFDVTQAFEVLAGTSARLKLSLEVEAVGVLRGGRVACSSANGGAAVTSGETAVVAATLPNRAVACGENLTVADRSAPDDVTIAPGRHLLHACWRLSASHPKGLRGKAASAEFAPEPALPDAWTGGPRDPFHGVVKKDFGFRVTVRVSPESPRAATSETR